LKYQRFTPFGCKYIGIRSFELEATTQFLNLYFMFRFGEWPHVCMLLGKIYTLVVPLIEIYTLVVPLIEICTL